SAATLLLLVSMVMATSPAGPRVLLAGGVEDRAAAPAVTAQAEQTARPVVSRRKAKTQEEQPAAWVGMVAPDRVREQESGNHQPRFALAMPHRVRVRVALLDLPPPVRA